MTKEVNGVQTVLVFDQDIDAGQIGEASLDYLAQDKFGNIWYLGSYTEIYEGGQFVNAIDAWLAGEKGAKPGVWMMTDPKEGMKFVQAQHLARRPFAPRSPRSASENASPSSASNRWPSSRTAPSSSTTARAWAISPRSPTTPAVSRRRRTGQRRPADAQGPGRDECRSIEDGQARP